ncbi:MAG TPA: tetratricopeptide repeat protein [Pirellulales bacterium]|nr:tetratricopeptide repeat protein [Pirellulales bacterium]
MGFANAGWKPCVLLAAGWLAAGVASPATADSDAAPSDRRNTTAGYTEPVAAQRPKVAQVQYTRQDGSNQAAPVYPQQGPSIPRQLPPAKRRIGASGPAQGSSAGGSSVLSAFAKTKTASSEDDFSEVIELCRSGLEKGLDASMTVYARRLMGWAHNRRGEVLSDQDKQEAALADFEAACSLDDAKWKYVHNRGVSHAMLGQYTKAIADFNQTLKMNPNYSNAYFNRGELRYEENDFVGAIADYTQAIKIDPRDASAFNSRGHAHYRLHEFREALADYHQAVRLDPNNAAAYTNRGDMYADFGRWANATSDYRMAMKLNPHLGRAYQSAAWLLATCPEDAFRSKNGALLAARKAIELDGEADYRYLETLAAAEASAGYFSDAVDTQAGAVAVAPDDYRGQVEHRLELYRRKSAYREAPRNPTQTMASRPNRRPTQSPGRQ